MDMFPLLKEANTLYFGFIQMKMSRPYMVYQQNMAIRRSFPEHASYGDKRKEEFVLNVLKNMIELEGYKITFFGFEIEDGVEWLRIRV